MTLSPTANSVSAELPTGSDSSDAGVFIGSTYQKTSARSYAALLGRRGTGSQIYRPSFRSVIRLATSHIVVVHFVAD